MTHWWVALTPQNESALVIDSLQEYKKNIMLQGGIVEINAQVNSKYKHSDSTSAYLLVCDPYI